MKIAVKTIFRTIVYVIIAAFLKQFFSNEAFIIVLLCYIASKLDFIK